MATGAGRGHTPAAPTGGTGTPTETSRPPQGHRHCHGDTGILIWIRGHRDLTGGTGNPGEHLHPHGDAVAPGPYAGTGTKASPQGAARVPSQDRSSPFAPLPGLKPPQGCPVAAAGAGLARFGCTRGTGRGVERWVRGVARGVGCEHSPAAGETGGDSATVRDSRSLPRRVSGPSCN